MKQVRGMVWKVHSTCSRKFWLLCNQPGARQSSVVRAFPFGKRERNISAWDGILRRRVPRNTMRVGGGLCSRAEDNILPPLHLIDGRHTLQRGIHFCLPENFARVGINRTHLAIARARKDHTSGGDDWADLGEL